MKKSFEPSQHDIVRSAILLNKKLHEAVTFSKQNEDGVLQGSFKIRAVHQFKSSLYAFMWKDFHQMPM